MFVYCEDVETKRGKPKRSCGQQFRFAFVGEGNCVATIIVHVATKKSVWMQCLTSYYSGMFILNTQKSTGFTAFEFNPEELQPRTYSKNKSKNTGHTFYSNETNKANILTAPLSKSTSEGL